MKSRLDYRKAAPDAFKAMLDLEQAVHRGSLEQSLIELVKMRASQINGCGYCLDMHSKDARAAPVPAVGMARSAVLQRA